MAPREINLGFMSIRHADLPERVAAAAQAGFDGIALRADRWAETVRSGWSGPRIRALLDANGLRLSEIEPLRLLRDDLLEAVVEMVGYLDAPRVQVTPPIDGTLIDLAAAAVWLQKAAARLPHTQLAIEFLPPTAVPDAAAALRLIAQAGGAPNLGLCVDSWHVFRGGGLPSLAGLDPARVHAIQINDGPLRATVADYIEDCIRFRVPCGQGEFDLAGFLQLLPGSTAINVEVINEELDRLPAREVAQLLYRSTVATLEACGRR
jgi:sugar phosphate isomerase/epimerase